MLADQRIEVHGTKGMLQADNARATTVIRSTPSGRSYDPNCYSFPQRYRDAYRIEVEHFITALVSGSTELKVSCDCRASLSLSSVMRPLERESACGGVC